jgi:monovalent cation/hydrogen antiporter
VELSNHDLLVLFGLLAGAAALVAIAPVARIPYPILLVLGGLALGFLPGIPNVELPPTLVLVAVLPPLLYSSAFFTSLRDLRANIRSIALLSVGLVVVSTVAVAAVAHAVVDDLSWPEAFVLGAVVSPTDAVAATAIASRLGVPRRIVSVIEGESLINDATGLVAYRFAVVAVLTGTFSLWHAGWRFVLNVVAGAAIGLAVGWVMRQVRRRIDNPPAEISLALLTGYFAFIPAQVAGVSAVIAVVTAGVYLGWHAPELTTVQVRLQGYAVWGILVFLLNALLFMLVGLQLHVILDRLSGYSFASLVGWGAAVTFAVIATRMMWIYPATYLPRLIPGVGARDPAPPWQYPTVVGWAGMRGAVSLAAALALPLETHAGAAFPARELIVYLTFCVILGTLVVQGLTLPALIRMLRLEDDGVLEFEEAKARIVAANSALERLDQLEREEWVREDTAERLRGAYRFRRSRFKARLDDGDDGSIEERSAAYQRLRRELLEAERAAVVQLRHDGRISDEIMHRVERDLDLEDSRLDI